MISVLHLEREIPIFSRVCWGTTRHACARLLRGQYKDGTEAFAQAREPDGLIRRVFIRFEPHLVPSQTLKINLFITSIRTVSSGPSLPAAVAVWGHVHNNLRGGKMKNSRNLHQKRGYLYIEFLGFTQMVLAWCTYDVHVVQRIKICFVEIVDSMVKGDNSTQCWRIYSEIRMPGWDPHPIPNPYLIHSTKK